MRLLWLAGGLTFFSLGLVGAFLPVVPTVPFMLVAAYFFARSSKRLHIWLLRHRHFGPPIRSWIRNGAVPRRVKWFTSVSILAGIGISAVLGLPNWVLASQAVILIGVSLFVWSRPDG